MTIIDNNLVLRAASEGTFDASETSATGVDFGGPDLFAKTYMVRAPSKAGTSPTLDVKIQESDNNSDWRDFLAFPQITVAGEYFVTGKSNARYRRHYSVLGGSGSPAFGAVEIAPVAGGRYTNW